MDSQKQPLEEDSIMVLSDWQEENLYELEESGRREDRPDFWGYKKKKD